MTKPIKKSDSLDKRYQSVYDDVSGIVDVAHGHAARSMNSIMTAAYWLIGQYIVEFEQEGRERANYGEEIIERLSVDLSTRFGRGFSVRSLRKMRAFFLYASLQFVVELFMSFGGPRFRGIGHRRYFFGVFSTCPRLFPTVVLS